MGLVVKKKQVSDFSGYINNTNNNRG